MKDRVYVPMSHNDLTQLKHITEETIPFYTPGFLTEVSDEFNSYLDVCGVTIWASFVQLKELDQFTFNLLMICSK